MINNDIIDHANAFMAAHVLLELDSSAIDTLYQKDAYHWVHALQDALARYQIQLQNDSLVSYSPTAKALTIQQALTSLTHHANNMVRLLTEEGKKQLMLSLAQPTISTA